MKIEVYKMNNLRIKFSVYDQDDEAVGLNDARITFAVKTNSDMSRTVINKTTEDDDINISGEFNHICEIELMKEDTEDITTKEYEYELLIELPDGSGGYYRYTGIMDSLVVKDVLINV